jgi:hypothetical protein
MFLGSVIVSRGQNSPADFVVADKTCGVAEQVIEQTKEQYDVLSLTKRYRANFGGTSGEKDQRFSHLSWRSNWFLQHALNL